MEGIKATIAEYQESTAKAGLIYLQEIIQRDNERWWCDINTGARIKRNVGEMIALVHSELSEGLEGYRKNLMDDHLPHRRSLEVELADAVIRIFDMAGGLGLDLPAAVMEKLAYNRRRQDHTHEARRAEGGKKF